MSRRGGKAKEAEKENAERWLLTYADLITLLLAFFIVMWSLGQTDLKRFETVRTSLANAFNTGIGDSSSGTSPLFREGSNFDPNPFGSQQTNLSSIQARFKELADKYGLAGKIRIRTDRDEIIISLSDNLLFDSASADLKREALVVLNETGVILKSLPNEVRVEGHTDNIPVNTTKFASNWELSSARATAVVRYLIEHAGVAENRLFAAGYGDTQPVAGNDTIEGRALNRRADIVIIYPNQYEEPIPVPTAPGNDVPSATATASATAENGAADPGITNPIYR